MKNLHLLPTNNLSKLYKENGEFHFEEYPLETVNAGNQYIYITSDEEIKEGDWYLNVEEKNSIKNPFYGKLYKANQSIGKVSLDYLVNNLKKIILTTDQNLIADGVQAISDEFLEWFVKNSSCEEVKTKLVEFEVDMGLGDSCIEYGSYYEIIIPHEEPKQENCCTPVGQIKRYVDCKGCDMKPTQETLEEFAERMYSEEDMKQFAFECVANFLSNNDNKVEIKLVDVIIDRLNFQFKQFKNK